MTPAPRCLRPLASGTLWLGLALCFAQSPPRLLPGAGETERVVLAGASVQLPCPVEADPDTIFFEWFREREPLDPLGDPRYRLQSSGMLRIKDLTPEDTGLYVCRAVNGFGRADVNVTLIVLDSPDSVRSAEHGDYEDDLDADRGAVSHGGQHTQDESYSPEKGKPRLTQVSKFHGSLVQRLVGSSISLKCVATADPRPQVSWLKNGKPLPDSNLPSNSRRGHWTLYLNNLQASDTGNYTCHVYNGLGSVSATFAIKVIDRVRTKPDFVGRHPLNVTVRSGDSAALLCLLASDTPPHVQWLKQIPEETMSSQQANSVKLLGEYFEVLKWSEVSERPDGSFLSRLGFDVATKQDSAKYICLAANAMGFSSRSAFLAVLPPTGGAEEQYKGLPLPLAVALGVSGAILAAGALGLGLFCRRRGGSGAPTATTSSGSTSTGIAAGSKAGTSAPPFGPPYVGLACRPHLEPGARLYVPAGHRTVPLNSIFL